MRINMHKISTFFCVLSPPGVSGCGLPVMGATHLLQICLHAWDQSTVQRPASTLCVSTVYNIKIRLTIDVLTPHGPIVDPRSYCTYCSCDKVDSCGLARLLTIVNKVLFESSKAGLFTSNYLFHPMGRRLVLSYSNPAEKKSGWSFS